MKNAIETACEQIGDIRENLTGIKGDKWASAVECLAMTEAMMLLVCTKTSMITGNDQFVDEVLFTPMKIQHNSVLSTMLKFFGKERHEEMHKDVLTMRKPIEQMMLKAITDD